MYYLISLICGIIFGMGLVISNMINPNRILNFLDITGQWDPTIVFVLVGAFVVATPGFQYVLRQQKPIFADKFYLPHLKVIDIRLIAGSVLFGIGWGMAGYCPGPAFTALGAGISDPIYFILGLIVSEFIYHILVRYKLIKNIRLG